MTDHLRFDQQCEACGEFIGDRESLEVANEDELLAYIHKDCARERSLAYEF